MNRCQPCTYDPQGSDPASPQALPEAQAVLADMTHHDDAAIIRAAEFVRDNSPDLKQQADAVATLAIMTGGHR